LFLAVDIGNTHTVVGLFAEDKLLKSWRIDSSHHDTEDEHALQVGCFMQLSGHCLEDIKAVAISSVVPSLKQTWTRFVTCYLGFEPLVINAFSDLGFKVLSAHPEEVGPDRIVNTAAGFATYGGPLIIVDLGTATTFDCVSATGDYMGGAIAPGIGISMEALFRRASKLTSIPWDLPPRVLGRNTAECLQSGLYYGFAGQVDGLVERLKQEMGGAVKVIATGGLAEVVARSSRTIEIVDKDLTLHGLYILWQRSINK